MDKKKPKVIDINTKKRAGASKILINFAVTIVVGLIYFYLELPPINLQAREFYFFFFMLSAVYCVTAVMTSGLYKLKGEDDFLKSIKNHCKIPLIVCLVFIVLILVGSLLSSVILRAGAYRDLLEVKVGTFGEDVDEINYNQIPMLDKASAEKLGDRKMGELPQYVSQFEVSNEYAQINYNGRPVRVTPLLYGDLIKWFNNRGEGIPAYIRVDMVTQEVEVVELDVGMKYTTNEHFSRNLYRYLRFNYPTYMFGTPSFEIDDTGHPFWICPKVVKTIGLFGGTDINGAVIVDAVTGENQYYEEVPNWVDRVYPADLIIEQYDYHGKYVNGLLNSVFGQKDVTVTTAGYNYIAKNDDVYMYTGITSVSSDQSNVGFILTNQRTKETTYYAIAGAAEYSAMSSAEGYVQDLGYTSTFPLLLNISKQPTYFMALKDNAGLVKQYAMVNVSSYQVVALGATVRECEMNYLNLLLEQNITEVTELERFEEEGVVREIRSAVIDGNTYYYLKLENSDIFYSISAADSEKAIIVSVGDTVKITYNEKQESQILPTTSLEILNSASAPTPPAKAEAEKPASDNAA